MATYDERARNYATNARQEYLNSLSYLTDDLAAKNKVDQQTLADKYNTLYEQIARQQDKVNTKFGTDAQAAYINKLMADRALDEQLSQLGVSTQGFGVNQRMLNENAYGQNLAALQQQQSEDLGDLANQLNDARGQYNVAAGQLASDYLAQLANAKQTQQSMADKYYQQQYANYLADLQYQDQMAQQAWERNYKAQQLAASQQRAAGTKSDSENIITESEAGLYDKLASEINSRNNLFTPNDVNLNNIKTIYYDSIAEAFRSGRLTEADAKKLIQLIDNMQYANTSSGGGGTGSFGGGSAGGR